MEEQNLQAMLIETCRLICQNNFLQIVQFQWQESLLLTRISNEIRDIAHRRICPFDSGLWISMKFALLTGHVIAVLIAFIVFRIDRPQAPLYFWVAGYSVGCAATFPVFCWRYARISPDIPVDEFLDFSSSSASDLSPEPCVSFGIHPASRYDGPQSDNAISRHYQAFSRSDPRLDIVMERFKVVLDCFFAVWIVVGNIWIFGVPSSPSDSPNFYRSSIVFLTFCCVRYALPFVICTFLCYCLAYITRAVGFQEEETHVREASENSITALPIHNYKAICSNYRNSGKRGRDIKSEFPSTGGFIAAGTEGEKEIPSEDAVCCICLEKYKDDEGLRVLPCEHHFHVDCVDKWLKIGGSCPLCKHKISGSSCPGDEFLESFLC